MLPRWSAKATNHLLEEIEEHKGIQSRFLTTSEHWQDAMEHLREDLAQSYSMHLLTGLQLAQWVQTLWSRYRENGVHGSYRSLFIVGRDALNIFLSRDILLKRGDEFGIMTPLAKNLVRAATSSGKATKSSGNVKKTVSVTATTDSLFPSSDNGLDGSRSRLSSIRGNSELPSIRQPCQRPQLKRKASVDSANGAHTSRRIPRKEERLSSEVQGPQNGKMGQNGGIRKGTKDHLPADNCIQEKRKHAITKTTNDMTRLPGELSDTRQPILAHSTDDSSDDSNESAQRVLHVQVQRPGIAIKDRTRTPAADLMNIGQSRKQLETPASGTITYRAGVIGDFSPVEINTETEARHPRCLMPSSPTVSAITEREWHPTIGAPGLGSIQDFLETDPKKYMPDRKHLAELAVSIQKGTAEAVQTLLEPTGTGADDGIQLYEGLVVPGFLDLCKKIFGVHHEHELLEVAIERQLDAPIPLHLFLKAIIAAAINDWVLEGRHRNLPPPIEQHTSPYIEAMEQTLEEGQCSTPADSNVDDVESNLVSPKLRERVQQRSKQLYVESYLHPENYSRDLSLHLGNILSPFLQYNIRPFARHGVTSFVSRLDKVFTESLLLAAQVSLASPGLTWEWVYAKETFDPRTMQTDGLPYHGEAKVVLACFFPGLSGASDAGELEGQKVQMFPASVAL